MSKPTRQELERWVVEHLICAAGRHGYVPYRAYDGGEWVMLTTPADVMDVVFSVDDCHVYFKHPDDDKAHCVVIVLGNDGWDTIADCSQGDRWGAVMAECDEFADSLEEMYGE